MPALNASFFATESIPLAPPDTILDGLNLDMADLTASIALDPLSSRCPIIAKTIFISLRHNIPIQYLVKRKDADVEKIWEMKRKPDDNMAMIVTMAEAFAGAINNNYDIITTPRPSANRDPQKYAVYMVAEILSKITGIPHIIVFEQSKIKKGHGVHHPASIEPIVMINAIAGKSVLLIDDLYNTGITMRMHRQGLINQKNHVDCMVYINYDN